MIKKLFSFLFLVLSIMLIALPVSAETSDGTIISTVVPHKYTITLDIVGNGSVEYEDVLYKDGDTIQVIEGTDMTFKLQADSKYKLKSVLYNGQNVTEQITDSVIAINNVQQDGTLAVTYVKLGGILNPATGDNSNILLWSILALGSAVTFIGIVFKMKKAKHS